MISTNASYYIDEVNNYIKDIVGSQCLETFFKVNSSFEIKNSPDFINDEAPPLLKTVWNIVNRGTPTRASITTSTASSPTF